MLLPSSEEGRVVDKQPMSRTSASCALAQTYASCALVMSMRAHARQSYHEHVQNCALFLMHAHLCVPTPLHKCNHGYAIALFSFKQFLMLTMRARARQSYHTFTNAQAFVHALACQSYQCACTTMIVSSCAVIYACSCMRIVPLHLHDPDCVLLHADGTTC